MRFPAAASLILLAPLLAGCLGDDPNTPAGATAGSTAAPRTADLVGTVTDDEARPLAGARVRGVGPNQTGEATTDAAGVFRIEDLEEGVYQVSFAHPDFEPMSRPVLVAADAANDASASLSLLPDRRPRTDILPPRRGHYDCAMEAVILTGDCMIVWEEFVSDEDPLTREDNYFFFNASQRWGEVVVELTWTAGGNNQLDGLHLYLAPANESRDPSAHHTKIAVAEGGRQPLRIELLPGAPHTTAERYNGTGPPAQLAAAGGEVLVLVLPRGHLAEDVGSVCDPTSPDRCFLGVGAAANLDFTVHVTVFYNAVAPDGYTALPP